MLSQQVKVDCIDVFAWKDASADLTIHFMIVMLPCTDPCHKSATQSSFVEFEIGACWCSELAHAVCLMHAGKMKNSTGRKGSWA